MNELTFCAVMKTVSLEEFKEMFPIVHRRHGRSKPYTTAGIKRLPCARCGSKASSQWQVCADGRLFRPLCASCDIDLNRMVLLWMNDPEAEAKAVAYAERDRT